MREIDALFSNYKMAGSLFLRAGGRTRGVLIGATHVVETRAVARRFYKLVTVIFPGR